MKHFIDVSAMDREVAILLFNNKIYEDDCNHQYIVADILKDMTIDIENVEQCKSLERENGMCPIDFFVGREGVCLVIQSIDSLKHASIDLLRELYDRYKCCPIGFGNSANDDIITCYDSFEEFKTARIETLSKLNLGNFILVEEIGDSVTILDVGDGVADTVSKAESLDFINLGIKIWGIEKDNSGIVHYFPVKGLYKQG